MIEFIKNKSTYKHLKFPPQFSKKFSRIRSTTNRACFSSVCLIKKRRSQAILPSWTNDFSCRNNGDPACPLYLRAANREATRITHVASRRIVRGNGITEVAPKNASASARDTQPKRDEAREGERERVGAKSVRRVEEIERKGRRWERRGLTFPTGYPPLPPTLLTYGLILNFQRV